MWRNPECIRDAERALDAGRLYIAMNSGRWWLTRRNGATKTWKRAETRREIPIKFGFKLCGRIGRDIETNWQHFRIADSRDEAESEQTAAFAA
jgi:hypothetical protein